MRDTANTARPSSVSGVADRCYHIFRKTGLSIRTLAYMLNVSPATIRRFFETPNRVRLETFVVISSFFLSLENELRDFEVCGNREKMAKVVDIARRTRSAVSTGGVPLGPGMVGGNPVGNGFGVGVFPAGSDNGNLSGNHTHMVPNNMVSNDKQVPESSDLSDNSKNDVIRNFKNRMRKVRVYKYICKWCGSSFVTSKKSLSCNCPFCSRQVSLAG